MKFRAVFSDSGVNILARRFLPCVEKFGRSVKLLLTDTDVIFLQSAAEADGLIVSVQLPKDLVFRDYEIKSAHGNKIGLRLDAGLLLKVLRANEANDADHLDVKLVKRRYPGSQELHPFLSFNSKGVNVSMVQDLPVSPPLPRGDIDAGLRAADPNPVPYFLDLHRDLARVQAVVDRGRSIEDTLQLATTRSGSLHLRVSVPAVDLGTEIQGFQVFPSEMEAPEEGAGAGSTPASRTSIRLRAAAAAGRADSALVHGKDFLRGLHCQMTLPSRILCGIGAEGGMVQFMYVYAGDFNSDGIAMVCTLPTQQED